MENASNTAPSSTLVYSAPTPSPIDHFVVSEASFTEPARDVSTASCPGFLKKDESLMSTVSLHPPIAAKLSNYSNSEHVLVSDSSESQLLVPDHDFGFYEWDFREEGDCASVIAQTAAAAVKSIEQPALMHTELPSLPVDAAKPQNDNLVWRSSIEDLMRPSIYKSRLSRELGTTLAAQLHCEMFGGVSTDSFSFEENRNAPQKVQPPHEPPIADLMQPQDTQPAAAQVVTRGRTIRLYTIDVVSHEFNRQSSDDSQLQMRRRSRTADVYYGRRRENLDVPLQAGRVESHERSGGLRKLLNRFSTVKKRK